MAIEYVGGVQGGRAGSTSTTTQSLTGLTGGIASQPAEGDFVVVWCSTAWDTTGATTQLISGNNSGAYSNASFQSQNDTYDSGSQLNYKIMGATPDTQITIPSSASIRNAQRWVVHVFRGVNTTTPLDVAAVPAGGINTGRPNPGAITPVSPGAWIVAFYASAAQTGTAYTAPTDFATDWLGGTTADTVDCMQGGGYYTGWTSGSYDPAAITAGGTTNAADSWTAMTIALRPAAYSYPLPYEDTFDRANSTDQGWWWVEALGTVEISSNALKATSAPAVAVNTAHIVNSNIVVSATIGTNDAIAIYARISGPTSVFALSSGGTVTITDHDDGGSPVDLTVATGSATFTGGDVFTLVVFGTTAIALKNGTIICSNIGGTALRTTASGATGLYLNSTTGTISNYLVEYVAFDIDAQPGSFTLTGADATLLTTRVIDAQPGSFSVSGVDAVLARGLFIDAQPGSFAVTGIDADLVEAVGDTPINAEPGAFSLSGVNATLLADRTINAEPGAVAVSGVNATLVSALLIDAQPGSFSVSGVNAALVHDRIIDAQPGAFSASGVNAELVGPKSIDAATGAFTVSGVDATLARGLFVEAQPGSFSVSGADASVIATRVIDAQPGSVAVSGANATLAQGKFINAEAGSFAVTGIATGLLADRVLNAQPGTFALTGAAAAAVKTFSANGDLGIFDPKYCDDPTTPGTVHRLLSYVDIDELGNPIPPNSRGTWWAVSQGISTSTDYGATWGSPTAVNKAISYEGNYLVQNEVGGLIYDSGESDSDQKWKMVFMRTVFDSGVGGYLDIASSSIMMRTAPAVTGPWSEPVTLMAGTSYDSGNTYNPGTPLFTDSGAIVTGEPGILAHPTSGFYMVYTGGTGTPANDYIKLVRIYKVGSTWTLSSIGNPLNNTTDITYFQALGTSFPSTFPDWDLTARFDGGDLVSASDGRKWLLITPTKSDYSYRGVACIPFDDIDTATLVRDGGGDPVIELWVAAGAVHHGAATASIYATDPGLTFSYIGATPFEIVETGVNLPRRIIAGVGAFSVSGVDATLQKSGATIIEASPGAFSVSGVDASLLFSRVLDAQPGSITVTGTLASLVAARTLGADPGSFLVSGHDMTAEHVIGGGSGGMLIYMRRRGRR